MRCLIGFFAAFWPAVAPASIIDVDDRIVVERGDARFQPTGRVIEPSGRRGTAFLVGECFAVTARHLSARGLKLGQRLKIDFSAARQRAVSRATVVLVPDSPAGYNSDWAVLRLDHCFGRLLGYYRLEPNLPPSTISLTAVGYPTDQRGSLVVDPACRIRGPTYWGLGHDCAALPGNSGGPLLQMFDHSAPVVVGMVVAGEHDRTPVTYSESKANLALPASILVRAMEQLSMQPPSQ